jgi:hypothetical protein
VHSYKGETKFLFFNRKITKIICTDCQAQECVPLVLFITSFELGHVHFTSQLLHKNSFIIVFCMKELKLNVIKQFTEDYLAFAGALK